MSSALNLYHLSANEFESLTEDEMEAMFDKLVREFCHNHLTKELNGGEKIFDDDCCA